jgi:hypothetical protein
VNCASLKALPTYQTALEANFKAHKHENRKMQPGGTSESKPMLTKLCMYFTDHEIQLFHSIIKTNNYFSFFFSLHSTAHV